MFKSIDLYPSYYSLCRFPFRDIDQKIYKAMDRALNISRLLIDYYLPITCPCLCCKCTDTILHKYKVSTYVR